ncbi:MAG: radical SAM protein [Coriobacteriales bacterium]|jgi:radical SAM superfamily enzyme YgiQ (UPF0313 family)
MANSKSDFYRPIFEDESERLQVSRGCSYNKCRFCTMYKGVEFEVTPREEIVRQIDSIANSAHVHRIFLSGGNAMAIPQDEMMFTLEQIREKIPSCKKVGCFARIDSVMAKSDQELMELAALGLDDIAIGAESGSEDALEFMHKGHTTADILEQCGRLDEAGLVYSLYYLAGIAGHGKCIENAHATAELFGKTNANRILFHTMTLFSGSKLEEDVEAGRFVMADEREVLEEIRTFVEELPIRALLMAQHFGNLAQFTGYVPDDREKIVAYIDGILENRSEESMRAYRKCIKTM